MREVFADTGYWVAMISSDDVLRDAVDWIASEIGACQVVTSEMVLVEVLNSLPEVVTGRVALP